LGYAKYSQEFFNGFCQRHWYIRLLAPALIIEIKDCINHERNTLTREFLVVLVMQRLAQCTAYQIARRGNTLIEPEVVVTGGGY
jgi:hypothetical protein